MYIADFQQFFILFIYFLNSVDEELFHSVHLEELLYTGS